MVLCDMCQKAAATIHDILIEDGKMAERNLCARCAEANGVFGKQKIKIPEFLESFIAATRTKKARPRKEAECAGCGMSYSQFKSKGRLGCRRCYEVFQKALDPLLEKVHDACRHKGRYPSQVTEPTAAAADPRKRLLEELGRKLEDAKAREAYEDAARLRDEIRRLETER
jgi:protein arginine kinase activator